MLREVCVLVLEQANPCSYSLLCTLQNCWGQNSLLNSWPCLDKIIWLSLARADLGIAQGVCGLVSLSLRSPGGCCAQLQCVDATGVDKLSSAHRRSSEPADERLQTGLHADEEAWARDKKLGALAGRWVTVAAADGERPPFPVWSRRHQFRSALCYVWLSVRKTKWDQISWITASYKSLSKCLEFCLERA